MLPALTEHYHYIQFIRKYINIKKSVIKEFFSNKYYTKYIGKVTNYIIFAVVRISFDIAVFIYRVFEITGNIPYLLKLLTNLNIKIHIILYFFFFCNFRSFRFYYAQYNVCFPNENIDF